MKYSPLHWLCTGAYENTWHKGLVDYQRCANTDWGHGFLDIWTLHSRCDSTRLQPEQICGQEATDQEVRTIDVRTKAKNCRNITAPWIPKLASNVSSPDSNKKTCWESKFENRLGFHVAYSSEAAMINSRPPKLAVFWQVCQANSPLHPFLITSSHLTFKK